MADSLYPPLFCVTPTKNTFCRYVLCTSACMGRFKCNFYRRPVTQNAISVLLMHYVSLDEYTDDALITEMNDACGLAPLYAHKWVHSHVRLTEQDSRPPMRRVLVGDSWRYGGTSMTHQRVGFS